MDFAAFGQRRSIDDPRQYGITPPAQTTRGFTGHEHVDGLDVIHMNGRIYDPRLGRFLQADPIVQDPSNGQNFNRYTYVWNNPLAFTDPTGYASKALGWLRTIASIAINVFLPGAGFFIGIFGSGMTGAMVAGFISGVVGSGTMKGGLVGAFSAGLFFKIGSHFGEVAKANADAGLKVGSNGLTAGQTAAKVLAHGMAGGVMSILQGGKFGHGFASAGFTEALAPGIAKIDNKLGQAITASLVGGTASAATGGKFANGAVTAAFGYAFNHLSHARFNRKTGELSVKDADSGSEAKGLFFSGTGQDDQIPSGDYAILQRGDKDGFRLEPYDSVFGDDKHSVSGQSLLRLHGPGRSNGCVTACDATSWPNVKAIIQGTSTSLVTVQRYWSLTLPGGYLLMRIPNGTEQVKYYGRLKVD